MVIKKIKKIADNAIKKYDEIRNDSTPKEFKPKVKTTTNTKNKSVEKRYIRISHGDITKAIVTTILLLALTWVIYEIRDILMLFFVSLLFAAALDPTIDKLEKYKIPRSISILVIFIILISVFVVFISSFFPILAKELLDLGLQTQTLVNNVAAGKTTLPNYLQWLNPILQSTLAELNSQGLTLKLQSYLVQFGTEIKSLAGNVLDTVITVSNGVANAILVLMLTFFMSADEKGIDDFFLKLFPSKYGTYITHKSKVIKEKVGEWLRGQIALMIAVGVATYIGLIAIGVEYAFTLALVAGITELIPVIGPILGLIAAIPIAANQSGSILLWVIILYFIIQRLENNILVPMIMKQATGLNPIVVIFAMLVGYQFMGVLGVIISVPVAAIIAIFLNDYFAKKAK